MSGPELAYVALSVRELETAVEFFGNDLGLVRWEISAPRGSKSAFAVGRALLVLFETGDPFLSGTIDTGIDHIAFSTSDPDEALREARIEAKFDLSQSGLNGGCQICVDPDAVAGVNLRFCEPLGIEPPVTGAVERIDHIGIASVDNATAENIFVGQLGCVYESRQIDMEIRTAIESFTSDKYGVAYHTRKPEPAGGLCVSFVTAGDCELEFLQDFDPRHGTELHHGTAGTTKQDQGAIGRFVARHGAGLHHIALKVVDIDALLAQLASRGRKIIDQTGRPGSRRARIGFVHPQTLTGVLLHFVEREDLTDTSV